MKSFSSSASHTHLTSSHSSVSMAKDQEGVSSPLSAVSVDQSLPSSTADERHVSKSVTACAWGQVCLVLLPGGAVLCWWADTLGLSGERIDISSSLLLNPVEEEDEEEGEC